MPSLPDLGQNLNRGRFAKAIGAARQIGPPIARVIVEHGPTMFKTAMIIFALSELSLGMGKVRKQITRKDGNKKNPPEHQEPYIRDKPGPHAAVNNMGRKKTFLEGLQVGRKWRRGQKRK